MVVAFVASVPHSSHMTMKCASQGGNVFKYSPILDTFCPDTSVSGNAWANLRAGGLLDGSDDRHAWTMLLK